MSVWLVIILSGVLLFIFGKKEDKTASVLSVEPGYTGGATATPEPGTIIPVPDAIYEPPKVTTAERTTTTPVPDPESFLIKPPEKPNNDVSILDVNSGYNPVTQPPAPIKTEPVTTTGTVPTSIIQPPVLDKPVEKPAQPVTTATTTVGTLLKPAERITAPVSIFPAAGSSVDKLIKPII